MQITFKHARLGTASICVHVRSRNHERLCNYTDSSSICIACRLMHRCCHKLHLFALHPDPLTHVSQSMAPLWLPALTGAALSSAGWALAWYAARRQKHHSLQPNLPPPRMTTMPHPDWVPGAKQPHPFPTDNWIAYDPIKEEKAAVYPMVISTVVPRPIALISSVDKDGNVNLAPYSYFNAVGHNPVTIVIGINRAPYRNGDKKDSLVNIEATGEFVVNIMSDWYVEAANHSCGTFDPHVDEMALAGLTPLPSQKVRAPRLKESAVHMECKLRQVVDIEDASGQPSMAIVIAEVVLFHVHEGVAAKTPTGKLIVDPVKLRPVSRLGGTLYGRVTELFDIGRPDKTHSHAGPAEYTASYQAAQKQAASQASKH